MTAVAERGRTAMTVKRDSCAPAFTLTRLAPPARGWWVGDEVSIG
jgi:hypothetical protein